MAKSSTSFEKGAIKTGGRKAGTPNRTTKQMRDCIQVIMDSNLERLEEDLDLMSPTNRWMVLPKLASYFMPTLTKNDTTLSGNGLPIKIVVEYADSGAAELGE